MSTDAFYLLAPDLLLLGLIVVLMLLEVLRARARWGEVAFVAGLVAALAFVWHQFDGGIQGSVVAGELGADRLAVAGTGVLLLCGLAVALGFPAGFAGHKPRILVAASLLGGLVMLGSASFATLFLGLELLSLPAFALIVSGQGRSAAAEGAFKYLVLSSVATALFLFGASLAYGITGSLQLQAFGGIFLGAGLQAQGAILLVAAGLFLKAALFPFHAWAPDAYAASRLPVTAFLASVVKAAVVLALVRVFGPLPLTPSATAVVAALTIGSIVFGNVAALRQPGLRRLLAYSSVAHAGYMVFALLDVSGSRAPDLLVYTLVYGLGTVLACASFAALCPGDDDSLARLDGQFARRPVAAALLAAAMLSLAGVPPLPGFFAKVLVFKSVIASGHVTAAVLAFVGSFLGLGYYGGVVLRMVRSGTRPDSARPSVTAVSAATREETLA